MYFYIYFFFTIYTYILTSILTFFYYLGTKKQLDLTVGIHPTAAEEFVTMRTAKYEVTKEGVKEFVKS